MLDAAGSNPALGFALTQSGDDISGSTINPSALMIRPTFSSTSSGYEASYAYNIKAITTDKKDFRINLATPVEKWVGGCTGGTVTGGGSPMTLTACNAACHASSTCYVIIHN